MTEYQCEVCESNWGSDLEQAWACCARAKAERAASEWQPIETAPRDGTTFIIGSVTYPYRGLAKWWLPEGGFVDVNDECGFWANPTHWMPLADLPKS